MVSPYLKRPLRTLEQALEDRARARCGAAPSAGDPPAARDDPVGLLLWLLQGDLGVEGLALGGAEDGAPTPGAPEPATRPTGARRRRAA